MYAQQIEGQSWVGEKLDKGKIEKMSGTNDAIGLDSQLLTLPPCSDQQLGQLYELMQAIQKIGREQGDKDG